VAETTTLRLFGPAREAAGTGRATLDGSTVGAILDAAVATWGPGFASVLGRCQVWVNGEVADRDAAVGDGDEVAIIPPVSGGAV
jgi:molybdopterin converting factor small subunit